MVMAVLSIIVGVAGSLISVAGLIVLYFEDEMDDMDDKESYQALFVLQNNSLYLQVLL